MASVEVMTACENVCRDFVTWLPKVTTILGDLGTFLVGVGVLAAFQQLSVWRSQAKALSRAEVAKSCLVAVYEVDDALRQVRNPFDSIPKEQASEKGITYRRRHERLVQYNEAFQGLRKAQIDHDIVLGVAEVSKAIDKLFQIRSQVMLAIEFLYDEIDNEERDPETRQLAKKWRSQISGTYSERDEFGQTQIDAINEIKHGLSDIARLSK